MRIDACVNAVQTAEKCVHTGREKNIADVSDPPNPDGLPAVENTSSPQESGAAFGTPDGEAGESGE